MDASHVTTARVGTGRAARDHAARSTLASLLQSPQLPKVRAGSRPMLAALLTSIVLLVSAALLIGLSPAHTILLLVFAGASVVLLQNRLRARAAQRELASIDFHLPLVMEEVVMGVQAGLDIVPALARVLSNAEQSSTKLNPVLCVFKEILDACEHGQSFRAALQAARKKQRSSAFSHALLHLSVAHTDGGNLVEVLRELAEATQRSFEESMEEMLATMPARAVMPLIMTFAGLMIFFLAVPLVQVLESLRKAMPQ
jgi:Flp pilus assembly protein TadB